MLAHSKSTYYTVGAVTKTELDFPLQVEKSGIKWLIVLFRWHDAFSSFNYESPDHKSIWCDMCESSKNGFYYFRVNIHIYSQGWKRKLTLFNGLVFLVLQVRTSHSQTIDSQTRHFWAIVSTMFDFFSIQILERRNTIFFEIRVQ